MFVVDWWKVYIQLLETPSYTKINRGFSFSKKHLNYNRK